MENADEYEWPGALAAQGYIYNKLGTRRAYKRNLHCKNGEYASSRNRRAWHKDGRSAIDISQVVTKESTNRTWCIDYGDL